MSEKYGQGKKSTFKPLPQSGAFEVIKISLSGSGLITQDPPSLEGGEGDEYRFKISLTPLLTNGDF